jgi:hypothetical protein
VPTLSDAVTGVGSRVRAFVDIALGPWPIRPVPLVLFTIAAISFTQTTASINDVLAGGARSVWLYQIPQTALIALLIATPLWIAEFIRRSLFEKPLTRGWYLVSLSIGALTYPLRPNRSARLTISHIFPNSLFPRRCFSSDGTVWLAAPALIPRTCLHWLCHRPRTPASAIAPWARCLARLSLLFLLDNVS